MSKKYPHGVGPADRWLIFAGVPAAVIAILLAVTLRHGNIRGVSERSLPYVLLFVVPAIIMGGRELYHRLPKRLVIPFGIIGWIITFVVMCWFGWFGPGALKTKTGQSLLF